MIWESYAKLFASRIQTLALALLGVAQIGGCGQGPHTDPPNPQLPGDLASEMSESFDVAIDLETAVIRGDVDAGRQYARWLASHEPHRDLPGTSGPFVAAVHAAADEASRATDLASLAEASTRMANGCGACHAATRGDLRHLPGPPPDDSESLTSRMARHVWAADRLWEALLERSPELWLTGAEVLQTSTIAAREISWDPEVTAQVSGIVSDLDRIAASAVAATNWPERASLAGELLTTCSRCHELVGIDPLGWDPM